MTTHLHDTIRDLTIGVGGPAGGLIIANVVPDPIIANGSVIIGTLAAITVIIRNAIGIYKDLKK